MFYIFLCSFNNFRLIFRYSFIHASSEESGHACESIRRALRGSNTVSAWGGHIKRQTRHVPWLAAGYLTACPMRCGSAVCGSVSPWTDDIISARLWSFAASASSSSGRSCGVRLCGVCGCENDGWIHRLRAAPALPGMRACGREGGWKEECRACYPCYHILFVFKEFLIFKEYGL